MLKDYLQRISEMSKKCNQKSVEEYLMLNGQECKITPINKLPKDIRKEIKRAIGIIKPQVKQCYNNAFLMAFCLKECEYWEGFSTSIIPCNHAWNRYKGYFIDITWEKLKGGVGKEYVGVQIPTKKVEKYLRKRIAFICSPLYQLLREIYTKEQKQKCPDLVKTAL